MYEVKDGARTLQFSGVILGESSSQRRDSDRWIEFKLFRTASGQYVLSRVGVSRIYHTASCYVVQRYNLRDEHVTALGPGALPCDKCHPTFEAQVVYPEKDRPWALVTDDPSSLINALTKRDDDDVAYLTYVARRLLDQASERDPKLAQVYRIEHIP